MKTAQLLAAAAIVLASASAMAGDVNTVPTPGTLSRATVQADLAQARASGELAALNANRRDISEVPAATASAQARSRDEVRAEARAAAHHHVVDPSFVGG